MHSVLITGATGFIGFHLAAECLRRNFDVHLVVRPGYSQSRLASLPGRPTVHVYDGSHERLNAIFQSAAPASVFHLAAHTPSRLPDDIDALVLSNILFGTQLLDASGRAGVKRFINTGTFSQHYSPDTHEPASLYSATKKSFEAILEFYTASTPIRSLTLKLFETYGHADTRPKLLNSLVEFSNKGDARLAVSPGEQIVDMVYVDDVVAAFLRADELLDEEPQLSGRSFSVDSGDRRTVREVVETFRRVSGQNVEVEWGGRPYRDREIMVPWSGQRLPGWSASIDLEHGIARLIEGAASRAGDKT